MLSYASFKVFLAEYVSSRIAWDVLDREIVLKIKLRRKKKKTRRQWNFNPAAKM